MVGLKQITVAAIFLCGLHGVAKAEFAVETESGDGVVDVSDFSWRTYLEQLNRFPERIGFICYNAYILNKTPDHKAAFEFFNECARRGHAPSMINLSQFHAQGLGVPKDVSKATDLLRQAAYTGYPAAEYEYGKAVAAGEGVQANVELGRYWVKMAAVHGDVDARKLLDEDSILLRPMPQ
jgi:TPR repeat protein